MSGGKIPIGNPRQLIARATRQQEREDVGGKPLSARVVNINDADETMQVLSMAGTSSTPVLHPFLSANSWHRVMPESGDGILITRRHDANTFHPLVYNKATTKERIDNYVDGTGIYRKLKQGEQDMFSSGVAGIFLSKDGVLEMRGGAVYGELNHLRLEHWMKAPVHRRLLHLHDDMAIGDEERLGYVFRQKSPDYSIDPIKEKDADGNEYFAKEYYLCLKTNQKPSMLVRRREGNVYDDAGEVEKQSVTNKNLRALMEYYNKAGDGHTRMEIDEEGNVTFSTPKSAEDGVKIKIPAGAFGMDVKKETIVTSEGKIEVTTQSTATYQSKKDTKVLTDANYNMEAKKKAYMKASQSLSTESGTDTRFKAGTSLKMESGTAMEVKAGATLDIKANGPATFYAPKIDIGQAGGGAVVTTMTHPVDFVTGLPILGVLTVRCGGVPGK